MNIFLSVAMCTFNGEKFIREQLHSILNQSITPNEIIISDDASSDKTLEFVADIIKDNPNIKFKILRNDSTIKVIKNFERALENCNGEWIFLSDQDDIWYPNKIETFIEYIQLNPKKKLVFSNADLIDEHGSFINSTLWEKWNFTATKQKQWNRNYLAFYDLIKNLNFVTGATVLFKKDLLKKAIPIDVPEFFYHDAWLALHAAAVNQLGYINKPLIKYRIHDTQQVGISNNHNTSTHLQGQKILSIQEFKQIMKSIYPKAFYLSKINNHFQSIIS